MTSSDSEPSGPHSLRALAARPELPSSLEQSTVLRLQSAGLLRSPAHLRWHLPLALAASLMFGVCVGIAGVSALRDIPVERESANFLLLVRDGAGFLPGAPGERADEYGAWARGLARDGVLIDAAELAIGRTILDSKGVSAVAENNLSQAPVSGYFLIRAENAINAQRIAAQCPHLKYGGSIELRALISQ